MTDVATLALLRETSMMSKRTTRGCGFERLKHTALSEEIADQGRGYKGKWDRVGARLRHVRPLLLQSCRLMPNNAHDMQISPNRPNIPSQNTAPKGMRSVRAICAELPLLTRSTACWPLKMASVLFSTARNSLGQHRCSLFTIQ